MSSFVRTACTPCCTVVSSRSHWRRSAALVSCSARSLFCADRTSARSCASTAANAVVRSSSVSVRGDGATAVDCAAADHCRCSGAARGVGATLGGLELVLERGVGAAMPLRGLRHERRGDGGFEFECVGKARL